MAGVAIVGVGHGLGSFITGLVVGIGIGLLLAPMLRSWLAWREWLDASQEARLTDAVLDRMERELDRSSRRETGGPSEGRSGP